MSQSQQEETNIILVTRHKTIDEPRRTLIDQQGLTPQVNTRRPTSMCYKVLTTKNTDDQQGLTPQVYTRRPISLSYEVQQLQHTSLQHKNCLAFT